MEEYKQRLKRQNVLLWVGIILLAALDVLLGIFWDNLGFLDTRLMTERARHMQSMLLFGFLVYFVVKLVGNKRRLKNLWQYEEEARWQKDERRILIGEKAAKLAADLALAGLVPPVVLPCLIPNFTSGAIAGLSGAAVVLTAAWKGWMGVPRKKGAAAVAVGLLVLNGAALWHLSQSPYALERVRFALHPELDPLGLGYFPMMVREMLSGAQWLGKGELGELSGAAGYLPGVSDYWLARVIHELGWAAGLALLALMTALFALGLRRCMRQRGMLGRLLSTAALTTLVLETVCFVVYDLGFPLAAPLVLPFLSTGGRYMVVNLLLLGLMLSAFREERLPQGQKGPAAQSSRGRPLISWRDGDLVIALGRRTGK